MSVLYRDFFDTLSYKKKFHPILDPTRWYNITTKDVLRCQGGRAVVVSSYYSSLPAAILDSYPNIGLDQFLFVDTSEWKDTFKQQLVFDELARLKGFHPTSHASRWYSISQQDVASVEGGPSILSRNNCYKLAIISTYPHIGLEIEKFGVNNRITSRKEKERLFFDKLAHIKQFDPVLHALRWEERVL